jgi:hypothetical protein
MTASSVCTSEVLTVQSGVITTKLSATQITVGNTANDTAKILTASNTATGTVTYTVYTDANCSTGARSAGTVTVSRGTVPNSQTLTFNSIGTFYWQAVYSGDAHNQPATSVCTSEQLTVVKRSPTVNLTLSESSIHAGNKQIEKAHGMVTLSGATSNAGGTVTYTVYTNNTCTTVAGPQPSPATVTVTNGKVPNSGDAFFPNSGNFYWQASYSGDGSNNAATSSCVLLKVT